MPKPSSLPKQQHKKPNSFCLWTVSRSRRSFKTPQISHIVFWTTNSILDYIWYFGVLSNIGCQGCPSKANNAMPGYSIFKKWKWYCQHHQKTILIWGEKLKIIWKNPKWPWEITCRLLRGTERKKAAGHVGVFCQNLGVTAYT